MQIHRPTHVQIIWVVVLILHSFFMEWIAAAAQFKRWLDAKSNPTVSASIEKIMTSTTVGLFDAAILTAAWASVLVVFYCIAFAITKNTRRSCTISLGIVTALALPYSMKIWLSTK